MNIAIVGGGTRCSLMLDLIKKSTFQEIHPIVVAVADEKDDAPGLVKARQEGLFVTRDYNDFFKRNDIDLIVELTGKHNLYNEILLKKKKSVRAIDHKTARLFWEVSFVSNSQQATKQKLKETKAMYDVIINDLIHEDVMVIASDYRIIEINKTLLKRLGIRREEAVGRFCYELSHHQKFPCSGEKHPCPLVLSLKSQEPSQTTHIHLDKENRELFYSISCYPLFEDGKVRGAIELSRDITKDIKLQKMMMQQEKLASVGRLAAGVAHEINNPMTTILTSAMLLQEETDPDDPRYADLRIIADETLRCRKIVASLLDFARQTKPAKKLENINDVIAESVALTRKQAAFNDVAIEQDFSDNLPHIYADKDQLQQSVINLTLNAIEATSPGGRVIISTNFVSEAGTIDISVSDTGSGILDEDMEKIFDPFFTTKETGTGLGLALTHGLIEQHGGTIDVKSKFGKGTTFTIRLPPGLGDSDAR